MKFTGNEKQKVFREMDFEIQNNNKPSAYMEQLSQEPVFKENPFNMLDVLKHTEQNPNHHPEGNVWNHTMLVLDMAAEMKIKSANQRSFMWAALLHDIGKPGTTRMLNDRVTSYDHDKLGAELACKFLSELTDETGLINSVSALVRWHMQIMFVARNMPYAKPEEMKKDVDPREIALLGLCDRLGRLDPRKEIEEETIRTFERKSGIEKTRSILK